MSASDPRRHSRAAAKRQLAAASAFGIIDSWSHHRASQGPTEHAGCKPTRSHTN